MSEAAELESPPSDQDVFMAVTDADEYSLRPLMTGDILERADGQWVVLVQHPCAMRAGSKLLGRLLACEVNQNASGFRTKWSKEAYYRMPLKMLRGGSEIDFRRPVVIEAEEALKIPRVAIMDPIGVNLLLQRWVHHNSRVVVKTVTYDEQSTGPYAEVEIVFDGLVDLINAGVSIEEANIVLEDFLLKSADDGSGATWRDRLHERQYHSAAHRALDAHIRSHLSGSPGAICAKGVGLKA